jgi:hypothetical protein
VSTSVTRRPFIGQITEFASPEDPQVTFGFKRCGVAENIQRQNLASKVRYVQNDDDGQIVSERDFPMGSLQLETILLALASWNLQDENERVIPISKKSLTQYLSPKEFDFCYAKALEVNPIWAPGGEDETKNA